MQNTPKWIKYEYSQNVPIPNNAYISKMHIFPTMRILQIMQKLQIIQYQLLNDAEVCFTA